MHHVCRTFTKLGLALTLGACAMPLESDISGSEQELIFGVDDRQEYGQITDPQVRSWADSVATILSYQAGSCNASTCTLYSEQVTHVPVYTNGVARAVPLCEDEPLRGIKMSSCSSFLVGDDLIMTAEHCLQECENMSFVFGFARDASGALLAPATVQGNVVTMPRSNVYSCKSIVTRGAPDYAFVRLDRPVENMPNGNARPRLPVRSEGQVATGAPIIMIGYPWATPLKATGTSPVFYNNLSYDTFNTYNDALPGNSGSVAIDAQTGLVEGVLTGGVNNSQNFKAVTQNGAECAREQICEENPFCTGASVWVRATLASDMLAACLDGSKDRVETDVDCGGRNCARCAGGRTCNAGTDCVSGVCTSGICEASCKDGVLNGSESAIDCGGSCAADCANLATCHANNDCQSGYCAGLVPSGTGVCQDPLCNDGVLNGSETGIDCGGTCPADCANLRNCRVNNDCQSGFCYVLVTGALGTCRTPTCSDARANGDETGIDCGGSCVAGCANFRNCRVNDDCLSNYCHLTMPGMGYCTNQP